MRAKFKCSKAERILGTGFYKAGEPKPAETVQRIELEFYPVMNDSPENKSWAMYTPGGYLRLTVDNPACFDHFEVGKEYYLDFFEVPAPETPPAS